MTKKATQKHHKNDEFSPDKAIIKKNLTMKCIFCKLSKTRVDLKQKHVDHKKSIIVTLNIRSVKQSQYKNIKSCKAYDDHSMYGHRMVKMLLIL